MERTIQLVQPMKLAERKLLRVAAYARVSCDKDAMKHSLAAQISYYNEYIQRNPDWVFAGIYADEAYSGTKDDRPRFVQLIQDCKNGLIDRIITKSISRFARNTVTLLTTVRDLRRMGIGIYFEEQNIDTLTEAGELMITLLASQAQEESRATSENCKWRIRKKFEEGYTTHFNLVGYHQVDGLVEMIPEEAELVRRIFQLYLEGYGQQAIANILFEEDAPTCLGGEWFSTTIRSMLRNEKYAGDLLLQKSFVTDHITKEVKKNKGEMPQFFIQDDHEAIVPHEVFEAVRCENARRAAKYRSLGEAVKAVNNRFLRNDVYIYLPSSGGDVYEPAGTVIQGVSGPGRLMIYGYTACRLNSFITVKGCTSHIAFQNLSLREVRPLNGSSRNSYLINLQMNHHVEFNNCTLDANNVTYDSIYCRTTHAYLINCGLYNALQGLEVFMGWAYMKNCKGSCSWAMVSYAGYIIAAGTVPAGSRGTGDNGQLFASNVTVNYGTAIPPVTPDQTTIQYATLTKSYRGGWRSDTVDVIQGVYSANGYRSGLSWNYGCMWFGNLRGTLQGTTIRSATLTLHRKTGSGSSSAKTVYLCAITNASASGAPSIAANYGALGTIGRNAQVTFSIPVAAVQGLANGTYGGLCLYEAPYNFGSASWSNCYMRMSGSDTGYKPYLQVVYNDGGTSVG